jgi:hypothetical protein
MPVILATAGTINRRLIVQASPTKRCLQNNRAKKAEVRLK